MTDMQSWQATRAPFLADIEAPLLCQICKDIYRTPVLAPCGHTYCSECIRRYSTTINKQCPQCRHDVVISSLKPNKALEDVCYALKKHRRELYAVVSEPPRVEKDTAQTGTETQQAGIEQGTETNAETNARKRRRTQTRPQYQEVVSIDEEDQVDGNPGQESTGAQCPVCNKWFGSAQFIEREHIARCLAGDQGMQGFQVSKPTSPIQKIRDISFDNLGRARKEMASLGLVTRGNKERLRARFREWMNIWNANADSSHPVAERELRRRLDQWENEVANPSADARRDIKQIDTTNWNMQHGDEFRDLINKARASMNKTRSDQPNEPKTKTESNLDAPNHTNQTQEDSEHVQTTPDALTNHIVEID